KMESTELVLNGTGLRTKRRLGMSFRVFVAALYLPEKTKDATKVIQGEGGRVLDLVFLRSLDRDTLQEAWSEGFKKNCKEDCGQMAAPLKTFNDLMSDVKDQSRLRLIFDGKQVQLELSGKSRRTGTVAGKAFAKNLLAVFVGDHPPSEELKRGLLGETKIAKVDNGKGT
ncbi:MAG: chalcone isomerase family protein, partial [Bdellovibrionales bacterium]